MENVKNSSIVLKIHAGTVRSTENLCATCRNSQITRGALSGRERVICHASYQVPLTLREGMAECNHYMDARRPSLADMEEIAWQLMTDKSNRKIGFIHPDELRRRDRGPAGF